MKLCNAAAVACAESVDAVSELDELLVVEELLLAPVLSAVLESVEVEEKAPELCSASITARSSPPSGGGDCAPEVAVPPVLVVESRASDGFHCA